MTLQAPLLTSSVDELVSLRPSELRQHDAGDPAIVEALIEEARRRTRRRRRRYGACALLAAAAVALFGFELSGGGSSGSALDGAPPARPPALPAVHALRGNGALTIMVGGNGEGHSGIFEVARDGHLRSVFPCVRPCYELESADWSPDGKRLAFAVTTISVGSAYDGLHIIDKATGNDLRVPLFGFMFGLDWSPNGDRLAYVATNGNPHFGRIYIEPTDWSRPQLLRTGSAGLDSSPSWSPDGKRIAFASQVTPYAKHKSVYVIDVDGHHRRLLGSQRLGTCLVAGRYPDRISHELRRGKTDHPRRPGRHAAEGAVPLSGDRCHRGRTGLVARRQEAHDVELERGLRRQRRRHRPHTSHDRETVGVRRVATQLAAANSGRPAGRIQQRSLDEEGTMAFPTRALRTFGALVAVAVVASASAGQGPGTQRGRSSTACTRRAGRTASSASRPTEAARSDCRSRQRIACPVWRSHPTARGFSTSP